MHQVENDRNAIRVKIRDYIGNRDIGEISAHTMRCFVGMIETGEATTGDFAACGGSSLAKMVAEKWWFSQ